MASEIPPSERGRDWANLFPEILAVVAKRLGAIEYLNFTAVCRAWASIASPGYGMPPPIPRKPRTYLLMRGDDGEEGDSVTLLDVFDDPRRSYKLDQLPEISGKWFAGAQFGWVALVDEFSNPSLLNPFTRARIELPPITTLPDVTPARDPNGSISGYFHPPEQQSYSLDEFRSAFPFRKLVLSSDPTDGNFTAAVIFGHCVLMFLRPGEKAWTYLNPDIIRFRVIEVIYREGKFLALTEPGVVYVIDPLDLSVDDRVVSKVGRGHSPLMYLVDSSGDLLHVYRDSDGHDTLPTTNEIEVRRLDPETGVWVPVPILGDRALFIGNSCSMSLPAGNGVKGNCVYLTDNDWDMLSADEVKNSDRDMGVFDMTNTSFDVLYPPKPQFKWPAPIWITSPPL